MKRDIVVVDLDDTLANAAWRAKKYLYPIEDRDWDAFWAHADEDEPNVPVIACVRALAAVGYKIYILSGRSDITSEVTEQWLETYGVPYDLLHLRPHEEHVEDHEVKLQWIDELGIRDRVLFVLEDRDRVVKMYRDEGFTCFQVRPGAF